MKPAFTILAATGLVLSVLAGPVRADEALTDAAITAEAIPLGDGTHTVIGQPLSYPQGRPAMKAFRITIPPGKATILHEHEVAIFAYVLSGTLEVDYGAKGKRRFTAGEGLLEAVRWCHAGGAIGPEPVVLVALYLGSPALKDTVPCAQ